VGGKWGDKMNCQTCGRRLIQGHGHHSREKYCNIKCFADRNVPDKAELLKTLNKNDNIKVTAELYGTTKQTLYRWLKKLKIKRKIEWSDFA
jgi:transcriptional regulator of acetoin/glycerol metabolism